MENFCGVILMTCLGDVIFMTSQNDGFCDFLKFYCVIVNF